jgi:hypothetical protein
MKSLISEMFTIPVYLYRKKISIEFMLFQSEYK